MRYCIRCAAPLTAQHSVKPQMLGTSAAASVHFTLRVSLYTVMSVVEHGQWSSVNTMTHAAVVPVQPFASNIPLMAEAESVRLSVPSAI